MFCDRRDGRCVSFDYVAAMIEGKQLDRPSIDIGNRMVSPIV
jgi:hypothetical protein